MMAHDLQRLSVTQSGRSFNEICHCFGKYDKITQLLIHNILLQTEESAN